MDEKLFLISCSDHKQTGGFHWAATSHSIAEFLSEPLKEELYSVRRSVLDFIRGNQLSDDERAQGNRGKDPRNKHLVKGPDFGDVEAGGNYLPAASRYYGRFFRSVWEPQDLHQPTLGVWENAWKDGTRTIILSALYGALLPGELIQEYTCHFGDRIIGESKGLVQIWKPVLSKVIFEIAEKLKVNKIIDLLSEEIYQETIQWNSIYRISDCFHRCFRESSGPGTLGNLGNFFREEVLVSKELPFEYRHDRFIQKPYFDNPKEAILFESHINSTTKRVMREGVEVVLPEVKQRYGEKWELLDKQVQLYILNSEYSYLKFRGLLNFDFTHASIGLTKAIEYWANETIFKPLYKRHAWKRTFEELRAGRKASRGLGKIEHLLNPENRYLFRPEKWIDELTGFLPLSPGDSLGDLCADLRKISKEYRNDWIHEIPMNRELFEECRKFVRYFFNRWTMHAANHS